MEHSFNVNIAAQYGIHTAILLKNLHFWIEKNKANNKHFYDGRYWTYNSKKAFSELFPYLTERQVKYTLEKMKTDELILVGNYNQNSYDKTNWYSLTDKALTLLECNGKTAENTETIDRTKLSNRADNGVPIDRTKLSNRADEIVQSYNGTNVNPYNKLKEKNNKKERKEKIFDNKEETDKEDHTSFVEHTVIEKIKNLPDKEISERVLAVFENKKKRNKPITYLTLKVVLDRLEKFSGGDRNKKIDILDISVSKGYDEVYDIPPRSYGKTNYIQSTPENTSYNLDSYEKDNDYESYLENALGKI